MTTTVVTPPGEPPVTLAEAKAFLRIGHDGEDSLVDSLVAAAIARVESEAGLALVSRTLRRDFLAWPATLSGRGYPLRPKPAIALQSVVIADPAAGPSDVTARFQLNCGRLVLRPWTFLPPLGPEAGVQVTWQAGYGSAADVPDDLKQAVLMVAADAYTRGRVPGAAAGEALPETVSAILGRRREIRL